jgi:hypothetical protein
MWHEIANEDKSVTPRRQILPPPMPAQLTVKTPVSSTATLYQWDEKGEMSSAPARLVNGKIALQIPDRVMVLKISSTTK